jgi:hypothetical protein
MTRPAGRWSATLFAVAVAVNFVWEMAQSVLFAPMGGWMQATWRCVAASLGDGVMVLIIAATGWLWFRRADWMVRPGIAGYALMATAGIAIAVLVERHALATGRWAYTGRMPLLPVVRVGLVPVLQMAIVPAVVFRVAGRLTAAGSRRRQTRRH